MAGISFGTPGQELQLLVDTGSGVTHVAGAGCGSACGLGLPESAGYNASASTTAQLVPCGDECSCRQCACEPEAEGGAGRCRYRLAYVDGSSSAGYVVRDRIGATEPAVRQFLLEFGVEQRQTGKVQAQGTRGLLAMDRSRSSVVGQVRCAAGVVVLGRRASPPPPPLPCRGSSWCRPSLPSSAAPSATAPYVAAARRQPDEPDGLCHMLGG